MRRLEGIGGVTLAVLALVVALAIGIAATAAFDGDDADPRRVPTATAGTGRTDTRGTDTDETRSETDETRTEPDEARTDDSDR